jgi:hypothetical protein
MWRRVVVAGLLGLGLVSSARALEPQAIVGDWVGEWNNGLGVRDAVYMTVTKVLGDRVEGTVYWQATPGTASDNRDLVFVGTLIGSPAMSFSCSVSRDGAHMDGFFQGTGRSAVSLAKKGP